MVATEKGKFAGLVELFNVEVIEHRMIEKSGKEPVFIVTVQNKANHKQKIKFEANNEGLFVQYPMDNSFSITVTTPQAALTEFGFGAPEKTKKEEKKVEPTKPK